MNNFIREEDLDYNEIMHRGGENFGDEDFMICKCQKCNQIYLIEYEVDTLYLDPNDLSKRVSITDFPIDFSCINCKFKFPETSPWIGPKASDKMRVTIDLLEQSPWNWIIDKKLKNKA